MEDLFNQLKFAAATKSELARQEMIMWQRIAQAFGKLPVQHEKPKADVREANPGVKCLNTTEATKYLGISRGTLYRLRAAGMLRHVKIGRSARYRISDLDALVEHQLAA